MYFYILILLFGTFSQIRRCKTEGDVISVRTRRQTWPANSDLINDSGEMQDWEFSSDMSSEWRCTRRVFKVVKLSFPEING